MKKIDFIYFDAGGGHRSAAMALKSVIDSQNRATGGDPWEIRLVNLQEVLDSLDIFRKITGLRLEDVYNKMLAKGWTLGSAQGLQFMHGVIRLYHDPTVRLLTRTLERYTTGPGCFTGAQFQPRHVSESAAARCRKFPTSRS